VLDLVPVFGEEPAQDLGEARGTFDVGKVPAGACHEGCVSHGWTKIGWRDLHAAGKGSPCESGQQYRRS